MKQQAEICLAKNLITGNIHASADDDKALKSLCHQLNLRPPLQGKIMYSDNSEPRLYVIINQSNRASHQPTTEEVSLFIKTAMIPFSETALAISDWSTIND